MTQQPYDPSQPHAARRGPHESELFGALVAVEQIMRERVAREEGRGGFFSFLLRAAPRYLTLVDHLRRQHGDLMQRLALLRRAVVSADRPDRDAALEVFLELMADIDTHEALEAELLRDALEE